MSAGARRRSVEWQDPERLAELGRGLSGLEFLERMLRGEVPRPPIAMTLDFGLESVEEGRVVFWAEPGEEHYNPIGMVHGGLAATLADSAMGCAVHTRLPAGTGYTTLELKINYVRPITAGTGRILCEGRVVHGGSRVATTEARVTDAAGKLLAHASGTCLIFPADELRDPGVPGSPSVPEAG